MDDDRAIVELVRYGKDMSILKRAIAEIHSDGGLVYRTFSKEALVKVLDAEAQWKKQRVRFYIGNEEKYALVKAAFCGSAIPSHLMQAGSNALDNAINNGLDEITDPNGASAYETSAQRERTVAQPNENVAQGVASTQTASTPPGIGTEYVKKECLDCAVRTLADVLDSHVKGQATKQTPVSNVEESEIFNPDLTTIVQEPNLDVATKVITTLGRDAFLPEHIDQYFDEQGLVGEYKLRKLLVYSLLAKAHVGIESLSGAGKTAIMDPFLELFPQEELLVLQQTSDKALFNNTKINDYNYWVITELQKVTGHTFKEIIKNLTEGKSSDYSRTNNAKDGVDDFRISAGKTVYYTLAITNDYFKKKDPELSRRFIVFHTDISAEQNERVIKSFAESSFASKEKSQISELLKGHVKEALAQNFDVRNPFYPYVTSLVPKELVSSVRVRSFIKHYKKLVDGSTIYHHFARSKQELSSQQGHNLFSSVFDNMHINELYGQMFYDNIMGFQS